MRTFLFGLVMGGASLVALAACDSSSTSSSSGSFGFDGGSFDGAVSQAPDGSSPEAGTPDGSGGNPEGGTGTCSVTLSGAVSKTIACTLGAAYTTQDDASGLSITTPSVANSVPEVTFALKVTGELQTKTYAWADSVEQAGVVYEGGSDAWEVSSSSTKGTSTVTLTSVGTVATVTTGKVYAVHGSITATYVPQSGSGADVTVTVTF